MCWQLLYQVIVLRSGGTDRKRYRFVVKQLLEAEAKLRLDSASHLRAGFVEPPFDPNASLELHAHVDRNPLLLKQSSWCCNTLNAIARLRDVCGRVAERVETAPFTNPMLTATSLFAIPASALASLAVAAAIIDWTVECNVTITLKGGLGGPMQFATAAQHEVPYASLPFGASMYDLLGTPALAQSLLPLKRSKHAQSAVVSYGLYASLLYTLLTSSDKQPMRFACGRNLSQLRAVFRRFDDRISSATVFVASVKAALRHFKPLCLPVGTSLVQLTSAGPVPTLVGGHKYPRLPDNHPFQMLESDTVVERLSRLLISAPCVKSPPNHAHERLRGTNKRRIAAIYAGYLELWLRQQPKQFGVFGSIANAVGGKSVTVHATVYRISAARLKHGLKMETIRHMGLALYPLHERMRALQQNLSFGFKTAASSSATSVAATSASASPPTRAPKRPVRLSLRMNVSARRNEFRARRQWCAVAFDVPVGVSRAQKKLVRQYHKEYKNAVEQEQQVHGVAWS